MFIEKLIALRDSLYEYAEDLDRQADETYSSTADREELKSEASGVRYAARKLECVLSTYEGE